MSDLKKQALAKAFQKDYMKKPRIRRRLNINKVIERYNEGESITDLSINFGLKKLSVCQLLLDNGITSDEINSTLLLGKANTRKQLNIRLDREQDKLLEEITEHISKQLHSTLIGNIEFSLPGPAGLRMSKSTVAKLILQDALQKFKQEMKQ